MERTGTTITTQESTDSPAYRAEILVWLYRSAKDSSRVSNTEIGLTISLGSAPFFLVTEVEGPVAVLAPPPTFTPFPEAETPVLWVDSLPLVGLNREARPSEVSLTNSPSIAVLVPPVVVVVVVPVLGIVNLTLSSLELVLVLGPALISPFE